MNIRSGILALLFLILLSVPAMPVSAQNPGVQPAPTTALSSKPDVVILIFPTSNGQYAVSAVYSKQVPQKQTEDSIQQVLAVAKWQGMGFSYQNKSSSQAAKAFGIEDRGPMSSITGFISGSILNTDGSLSLGPFLMGFRDQNTVQLMIHTTEGFVYRGPRAFNDPRVDFTCEQKEGALICMANIKDHRMEELTLPRFDSATDPNNSGPARPAEGGNNALKLGAIIAASLAVGVAVFLLARRAIVR